MVLSSFDIKKQTLNSILDFSLNVDTHKKSGLYSMTQISEMLALAIEINNLINALDKDSSRMNIVKPEMDALELRKLKRVLELFLKYGSDLNSISIDIGENLSSTNRHLQKGIDYIFNNLSRKDYKQVISPKVQASPQVAQPKPVVRPVNPQTKPKAKPLGLIAPLMFLIVIAVAGMSVYNFFFNGSATTTASLVREYRSDRKLSSVSRPSSSNDLKVYGTFSVLKILKDNQGLFQAKFPSINLEIESGDSGDAIGQLIDGKVSIAASSRISSVDERKKAIKLNKPVSDHKIALDSVVVFTNKSNPIQVLSIDDLKKIYKEEHIKWADILASAPATEISKFSLSKQSGTYAFFKDRVMFSEAFSGGVIHVYDPLQMIQLVSDNPNAIGFASLSAIKESGSDKIKVIKIASVFNEEGTKPLTGDGTIAVDVIQRGEYPLTRYLYLVTAGDLSDEEAKVIDFMRSPDAQSKLANYGLVGLY